MIRKMMIHNLCLTAFLASLFTFVRVNSSQSDAEPSSPSNRLAHNPFLPPQQSIDPQSIFPYLIIDGDIVFPENAPRYTEQNPHWQIYEDRHLGTPNVSNNLWNETSEAQPGGPETEPNGQPQPVPSERPITRIPHYPTSSARPTHRHTTTTALPHRPATIPTTRPPTTPEEAYDLVTCPEVSEAFDKRTRKCHRLATQGPCPKDNWWVLNKKTHQPECRSRPCPAFFSKSPVTQECILMQEAEKEGVCGVRENLVNNVYGEPECMCMERNYRLTGGLCYPTYQRGPCRPGHYVIYNQETRTAGCEHNKCNMDNYVLVDGICYELGAVCGEHGEKNIYINPHDGVVGCYDFFRLPVSQTKV